MRPSVRQLEYAVALSEQRHFGRAARACAVTQPALSAQIQALEALLGVRLFERSRRGVTPTPAGVRVLERAREALRALDGVCQAAATAREPLSGSLRLGVIPTIAPYLLPRWLPRVRATWPKLRLYLHEDRTARLVAQLTAGELDLLLLALPVASPACESFSIAREPFVLAAPAGHPLARGRRPLAQSELAGAPILLLEDGHCLRDQALAVCGQAGASASDEVRAASLATLVQMVASGLGVTLLPLSAVDVEVRDRAELAVRAFQKPPPTRELGLLWRRASPQAEEFRLLGERLRQLAREGLRAG
jgi:LysR family hydrogen peroxide-inducible transcriptional activator